MTPRNRLRPFFKALGWPAAPAPPPARGSAAEARQFPGGDEHEHEHEHEHQPRPVTEHPFASFDLPVARPEEGA